MSDMGPDDQLWKREDLGLVETQLSKAKLSDILGGEPGEGAGVALPTSRAE